MRTSTLGITGPEVSVIGPCRMGMTIICDVATPRYDAASIS